LFYCIQYIKPDILTNPKTMANKDISIRYQKIISFLQRKSASFEEILAYLETQEQITGYGLKISKRTFQRDIQAIASIYGYEIENDKYSNEYYIKNNELLKENQMLVEALDIVSAFKFTDSVADYVLWDNRRHQQGTENLHGLIHAIKNKYRISFVYAKYYEEISQRMLEPYILQEFKSRWYVFGKDLKDGNLKTFALDRLSGLEITNIKFSIKKGFDTKKHFKYSFGLYAPDKDKPDEVIISFSPAQGNYVKSLPLHHSQKILIDNDNELRIQLKLFVAHDFIMELLSIGHSFKVIKPKSLVKTLTDSYRMALEQYEDE